MQTLTDIEYIRTLAVKITGSTANADAWLNKPRRMFNNMSAIECMETEYGMQLVEETLIQLDNGYF